MASSDHTSTAGTPDKRRAGYIAGLRRLADVLENTPELPLPFDGSSTAISIFFHGIDSATFIAAARAFGAVGWQEKLNQPRTSDYELSGKLAGLKVDLDAKSAEVCTPHVVAINRINGEDVPVTEWTTPLAEILTDGGEPR